MYTTVWSATFILVSIIIIIIFIIIIIVIIMGVWNDVTVNFSNRRIVTEGSKI
jgi:hypothetical protein